MSDLPVSPLVLIGVGSSFVFSGLFYNLYQRKKEEIRKLKEIPIFKPDQHLLRILKASPHRRLQYVAVEGMVQADGDPLDSQFVPRCPCVIRKTVVEEHWKFWNSLSRTWNSRRMNRKEANDSVPFSLVCPQAYVTDLYVKVHNPLEASGGYLERVHHRLRRAQVGLLDEALQGLNGEKPLGQEEREELLRVGATLTGFGEVVLEGGCMRLQAPVGGRSYLLVPTDYGSFMARHQGSADMFKTLSAVCGITGASLLAALLYGAFGRQSRRE